MSPAISHVALRNVTKIFGAVRAVSGLTIELQAGQTTAVMGPNGAGKSTLLAMVSLNLWPTVGKEMLDKIHEEVRSLSCEVAMVFILKESGPAPVEFFESQGYEQAESKNLGYMWKDAAMEWQPENSVLLYKKLREQRIMVPM